MSFVCPECARVYPAAGHCTEDGQALQDALADPLLGQLVGPYRIARLLGLGGMGEVYLAVQPGIGSRVAIKFLSHAAALSRVSVERFFSEAKAVNVIRHEGIVSVLDLAQWSDGRPYIVMEYLEGAPLTDVFERYRPVPLGGLVQILLGVLQALGAAHRHGITHRDLKPDNIFVTNLGRTKLLDFGVAKLRPEITALSDGTSTGALLGTPYYMSPEQARGRPVDPRADLYAAGLILYEGVTGSRPFQSENLYDLLRQHIEETPARPSLVRPDLPPALETVILRALEKEPERRFQSADELADALSEAARYLPQDSFVTLTGQPSPARLQKQLALRSSPLAPTAAANGTSVQTSERARRSRWLLVGVLAAVAFIGLMGLSALGFVLVRGSGDKAQNAPKPAPVSGRHDVMDLYPKALAQAQIAFPDAQLTNIVAKADARGKVDVSAEWGMSYTFMSPKRAKRFFGLGCAISVTFANGVMEHAQPPLCGDTPVREPRCKLSQVLKKLNATNGALLTYGPEPEWRSTESLNKTPDDC